MRIIIAPNSFRNGPDALSVATAMAEGVRRVVPNADTVLLPLSDGGDGTLDTLVRVYKGVLHVAMVRDPRGDPVQARFGISSDGTTAFIEMAEASGLRLINNSDRNPLHFSTYGTGELISNALNLNVKTILLGAGGSSTTDIGAGALAALGIVFLDAGGNPLNPTPAGLMQLADIDLSGLDPRLQSTEIIVLSDTFAPLSQNVLLYGPQKGIGPEISIKFDRLIKTMGFLARRCGYDIVDTPWTGAGGGLAGGMVAFAGAKVVSGVEFITRQTRLLEYLSTANILFTGEGRLDASSWQGKLPIALARIALEHKTPVVIIAGHIIWEEVKHMTGMACFNLSAGAAKKILGSRETLIQISNLSEQIMNLYQITKKGFDNLVNDK